MSSRGYPVSELSDEQRAAVAEQLGADRDVKPANKRTPYTGSGARRGKSKLEQAYEAHVESQAMGGVRMVLVYEPLRVLLGHRCSYAPDFWARPQSNGVWQRTCPDAIEVKPTNKATGRPYMTPEARVKTKAAARSLDRLGLRLYVAWRNGAGEWVHEQVKP